MKKWILTTKKKPVSCNGFMMKHMTKVNLVKKKVMKQSYYNTEEKN